MKTKILTLFAIAVLAVTSANAQFFVISANPNPTSITDSSAIPSGEILTSGPVPYFVKYKKDGTSTWMHSDTLSETGPVSMYLHNLLGNTKYYYEFSMYDTVTGQTATSADGYYFITNPNPVQTAVTVWTITTAATSASFNPTVNAVGHTALTYVEYGAVGGGFPYHTDTILVSGANQHPVFSAYGLNPSDSGQARVRTYPVGTPAGVQPTISQAKKFYTQAILFADAGVVTQIATGQDTAKVSGVATAGNGGQFQWKFDLWRAGVPVSIGGFTNASSSGTVSHTFTGLLYQGVSDYVAFFIVKDGTHYDTTTLQGVQTHQVPQATGSMLTLSEDKHFGNLFLSVNPKGLWAGSTTKIVIQWGDIQNNGYTYCDSIIVQPATTAQTLPVFVLGWFNPSTTVKYKVTATNDGGTITIIQSNFTTKIPMVGVGLSTGQVSVNAGTMMFQDWGYSTAVGDSARITMERVSTANGGNVLDSVEVGSGYVGTGLFSATMVGPINSTVYVRAKAVNIDGVVTYSAIQPVTTQGAYPPDYLATTNQVDDYTENIWISGDAGGYESTITLEVKDQGVVVYSVTDAPVGSGAFTKSYDVAPLYLGVTYDWKVCIKNNFYGEICKPNAKGTFQTGISTGVKEVEESEDVPLNYVCEAYITDGKLLGECTVGEAKFQPSNLAERWNTTGMVIMKVVKDDKGQAVHDKKPFKVVLTK